MSAPWIDPQITEQDRELRRRDEFVVLYDDGTASRPFQCPIDARHALDTPPYGRRMIRLRDGVVLARRVAPDLRNVAEDNVIEGKIDG